VSSPYLGLFLSLDIRCWKFDVHPLSSPYPPPFLLSTDHADFYPSMIGDHFAGFANSCPEEGGDKNLTDGGNNFNSAVFSMVNYFSGAVDFYSAVNDRGYNPGGFSVN